MKLNVVKSHAGMTWFRLGVRTFMRSPMLITGMFFLNLIVLSLVAELPWVGVPIALMLVPASTVMMMVATEQVHLGLIPRPTALWAALRNSPPLMRNLLAQGAVYAVGMFAALGATALADGGQLARLYLEGGRLTAEQAQDPALLFAMLIMASSGALLSMVLWHAPGLAYWHGVGAAKSMFFSMVACARNIGAFTVYSILWMTLMVGVILLAGIVAGVADSAELFPTLAVPAVMIISGMFITSIYFTFHACFQLTSEESP